MGAKKRTVARHVRGQGVTEDRCVSFITKTHRHINEFIKADPALSGTITSLMVNDIAVTEAELQRIQDVEANADQAESSDMFFAENDGVLEQYFSDSDSDEE